MHAFVCLPLSRPRSFTVPSRARSRALGLRATADDAALRVVVTGGTRGVGLALSRELIQRGHQVAVCGRSAVHVELAKRALPHAVLVEQCDVADADALHRFAERVARLGDGRTPRIDAWINNAGAVGRRGPLATAPAEAVIAPVHTNLLGTLLGCREAIRQMQQWPDRHGHVFNTDGAGVFGAGTPNFAAYGATKRAMPQLMHSLNTELRGSNVSVHTVSPGMVLTELLLRDSTAANRVFFNWLAERPETVAAFLAPRIVQTVRRRPAARGAYIRFKTLPAAFATIACNALLPHRRYRFFDRLGNPVGDLAELAGEPIGPGKQREL
ncbi:hypothetical protein CDCA_CDCA05G1625 [Cyanidium caldarium]|uniref:Ketoreductase domain-containing protein n=1 Tax=Cyanidium caldarium TaxID=2771 RepID=A0AAV9IU21_CYACA|nr:hypothetical protein CDCA_CDCA05G1625 [Cyanidium caldarium]